MIIARFRIDGDGNSLAACTEYACRCDECRVEFTAYDGDDLDLCDECGCRLQEECETEGLPVSGAQQKRMRAQGDRTAVSPPAK